MELESLESFIRAISRRLAKDYGEIEDLEQEARLAALKAISDEPDAERQYFEIAITEHLKELREKDSTPLPGKGGLESRVIEEGASNLLNKLSLRSYHEQCLDSTVKELKAEYGRFWFKKISESHEPKQFVRDLFRKVILQTAKVPKKEIPDVVDYAFFKDRKLARLLWVFYRNSPFQAINDVFKGEFLPWDFRRKPNGFWRGHGGYQNCLSAIEWLLSKEGVSEESGCKKIVGDRFDVFGLGTMLDIVFNGSPYLALKTKFPDLKPWHLSTVPKGFVRDIKYQKEALSSFIMENGRPPIDNLDSEETYELGLRLFVTRRSICDHGMRGVMNLYSNSSYEIFAFHFPRQILPWTLMNTKSVWEQGGRRTASLAVQWLFDKYLEIPLDEIPQYASYNFFRMMGFSGMITSRRLGFGSCPYLLVDNAYPGLFAKDDFKRERRVYHMKTQDLQKHRK